MICFVNNYLFIHYNVNTDQNTGIRQAVNVEWLVGGHPHPVLDPVVLISDANRTIGILLNLLLLVGSLPTCLTITVVNW